MESEKVLKIKLKIRINNLACIFDAEALAITRALDLILDNKIKKATIISDSESVLRTLAEFDKKGNANSYIHSIRYFFDLPQKNPSAVEFLWIPKHCGISGTNQELIKHLI